MKKLSYSLVALMVSLFALHGCDDASSSKKTVKPNYRQSATDYKKADVKKKTRSSNASAVESIISYGSGGTALRIKQRAKEKLNKIQNTHNQRISGKQNIKKKKHIKRSKCFKSKRSIKGKTNFDINRDL